MARTPKTRITINEDAIRKAAQPGLDGLQAKLTAELQATLRELRDEMEGQPADDVQAELVKRLDARIPGFRPNDDVVRRYAEAISEGTLTD